MKTFQDFCREKLAQRTEGWDKFANPAIEPMAPVKTGPTMEQKMRAAEVLTGIRTPGVVQALSQNSPRFGEKCLQFQTWLQNVEHLRPKEIEQSISTVGDTPVQPQPEPQPQQDVWPGRSSGVDPYGYEASGR